jgi:hypothetical protein
MRHYVFPFLVVLVLLSGCGQARLMNLMMSSADVQNAKTYIDLLREHKFDQIEQAIDPRVRSEATPGLLMHMASFIPAQDPISTKVVGSNTVKSPGVYKSNITFEYQYPNQWLLINVAMQREGDVSTIVGFNVKPLDRSIEDINGFSLSGKNALQYGVLVAAILASLLSVIALVLCIRTRIAKKKWMWIVAILFGVGSFAVNWTTGDWQFLPIYIRLFSAGAVAPLYGPLTIYVSLPLGAIWFLLKRKELAVKASASAGKTEPEK